jgi:hypothetical protein
MEKEIKENKTKLNFLGIYILLVYTLVFSIILMSISGDLICKINFFKEGCLYGNFVMKFIILIIYFLFLKDTKFIKEVR